MSAKVTLSDAKARLSELVRNARALGEDAVITVDGEPDDAFDAVELVGEGRR